MSRLWPLITGGVGAFAAAIIAVWLATDTYPANLVLFDVRLTKTANFYLRDDGLEYSFFRQAVGSTDKAYYIDQFYHARLGRVENAERVFRYPILHDSEGMLYLSAAHARSFRDDDHYLDDMSSAYWSIEDYLQDGKEGEAAEPPRDLDAYRKDGLRMDRTSFGKCDPLNTYTAIQAADIDDSLNRINETTYDRSLVLAGDLPMLSSGSILTEYRCPRFADRLGRHSTKANAYAFGVTRLDRDYILATSGFPLAFIVKDPRTEFCYAISYRDAYGTGRILYAIYTSPDRFSEMIGEADHPGKESRLLTLDEYPQRNEARYRKLVSAIPRIGCVSIRK